jgi:hypothetical protein
MHLGFINKFECFSVAFYPFWSEPFGKSAELRFQITQSEIQKGAKLVAPSSFDPDEKFTLRSREWHSS